MPGVCRKCGEPDRRGSATTRRRSRARLLADYGNGEIALCVWCGDLVGNVKDSFVVGGRRLEIHRLERDRLMPGEGYAYWNLVPSCGPCNRARAYAEQGFDNPICYFGASRRRTAADVVDQAGWADLSVSVGPPIYALDSVDSPSTTV